MIFFSFLYIPQNVSVFGETLQTHLDCEYVNANFLVCFLNISKYVLLVEGAYAPGSRIKLPKVILVHSCRNSPSMSCLRLFIYGTTHMERIIFLGHKFE
jgi:hypothetical protein